MLILRIVAVVHTVEYDEIKSSDFSTVDLDRSDEIGRYIEWPVLPRVGEWFEFPENVEVIGRVLSIWHFRDGDGEPEFRVHCLVENYDYDKLLGAGWKKV